MCTHTVPLLNHVIPYVKYIIALQTDGKLRQAKAEENPYIRFNIMTKKQYLRI